MASNDRNALADLAERLNNGYISLVVNGKQMATFTTAAFPELEKAGRIIAELAKVQEMERMLSEEDEYKDMPINVEMGIIQSYQTNCIHRCRVIAEE